MKKGLLLTLTLLIGLITQAQSIRIGDIACVNGGDTIFVHPNDYVNGAIGVVFYIDESGQHGWIIDLYDAPGEPFCYSTETVDIDGIANYGHPRYKPGWPGDNVGNIYDLDGYSNTVALHFHPAERYPAAWAVDLDNGWYLPTIGQLNLLTPQMPYIIQSLQKVGGNPLNTERYHWYWSSSEFVDPDGNACCAWGYYGTGYLCALPRSYKLDSGHFMHVRAVRNF